MNGKLAHFLLWYNYKFFALGLTACFPSKLFKTFSYEYSYYAIWFKVAVYNGKITKTVLTKINLTSKKRFQNNITLTFSLSNCWVISPSFATSRNGGSDLQVNSNKPFVLCSIDRALGQFTTRNRACLCRQDLVPNIYNLFEQMVRNRQRIVVSRTVCSDAYFSRWDLDDDLGSRISGRKPGLGPPVVLDSAAAPNLLRHLLQLQHTDVNSF